MQGASQAHLIEATDGYAYVVKFTNSPQGRRILINEWIASIVLNYLEIATPERAIVFISEEFLTENPDTHLQLRTRRQAIEAGYHFGSRFPGDLTTTVVYDVVSDTLLDKLDNIADFRGVLAFDKWMGNADSRQAIFFHPKRKERIGTSAADGLKEGMMAQMIDNGQVFEGSNWRLAASSIQGLYFRPEVYKGVRGLDDFEPWLTRIVNFPKDILNDAAKALPSSWLLGDEKALEALLGRLLARRRSVPNLIGESRSANIALFPNWR
jgi:hypothetical protein